MPDMRLAALTMVFNERRFLPVWLNHYGRQVGFENLFVIDDGSDDGSTTGLGPVRVMHQAKADLDEEARARRISDIQAQLLDQFDAVIVADVDELLVVDPTLGIGLRDYARTRVETLASATGLNVHHDRLTEAPLQAGTALFRQRRFVQFDWGYCKTLLSRVPIEWGPGFHVHNQQSDWRSDLYLFHLRAVDYTLSLERLQNFAKIHRSVNAISKRHSEQFDIPHDVYLRTFYYEDREMYDNAAPADGFDAELAHTMSLLRSEDYPMVRSLENRLMQLPQRFADCIAL